MMSTVLDLAATIEGSHTTRFVGREKVKKKKIKTKKIPHLRASKILDAISFAAASKSNTVDIMNAIATAPTASAAAPQAAPVAAAPAASAAPAPAVAPVASAPGSRQLPYGVSLCWRPCPRRHGGYALREVFLGWSRSVHPRLSRHDHQALPGLCLRQLSTAC